LKSPDIGAEKKLDYRKMKNGKIKIIVQAGAFKTYGIIVIRHCISK
jgi:hypothetical protein